jgi:hypothetical protein
VTDVVFYFCYTLQDTVAPVYLGGNIALEATTHSRSLLVPTIWSLAGASLMLISKFSGKEPQKLEADVRNGKIKFYGPYIVSDTELRERIASNLRPRRFFLPVLVPSKPLQHIGAAIKSDALTLFPLKPLSLGLPTYGAGLAFIPVNPASARGPVSLNTSLYRMIYSGEERIGVALDRERKVVDVRRGSIYSYSAIRDLKLCGPSECFRPSFCVEALIEESGISKRLQDSLQQAKKLVVDVGGKNTLATITISSAEPTLISLAEAEGDVRLAVSHIGVFVNGESGKQHVYTTCGRVLKHYHGLLVVLSGWSYRENIQKPPILTLAPGSIYQVSEGKHEETVISHVSSHKYWAYVLLRTSVPVEIQV